MKKKSEVLCEIIYRDHKLGIITSRIGIINEAQLNMYSTNYNEFIIFKERYNAPIFKSDIEEIIIHQDNRKISVNKENSKIIKFIEFQNKGKIS